MVNIPAPFELIYQMANGHLVGPDTGLQTLVCPTCLKSVAPSETCLLYTSPRPIRWGFF